MCLDLVKFFFLLSYYSSFLFSSFPSFLFFPFFPITWTSEFPSTATITLTLLRQPFSHLIDFGYSRKTLHRSSKILVEHVLLVSGAQFLTRA